MAEKEKKEETPQYSLDEYVMLCGSKKVRYAACAVRDYLKLTDPAGIAAKKTIPQWQTIEKTAESLTKKDWQALAKK